MRIMTLQTGSTWCHEDTQEPVVQFLRLAAQNLAAGNRTHNIEHCV